MTVINILLVEDNPGDVRLFKESFKESEIENKLHVVGDGVEAMSFLKKEGKYIDSPRPNLILLDIRMPKKNGYEVLDDIRKEESLSNIPVVILTATEVKDESIKNYSSDVICFLKKPESMDQFILGVQSIFRFLFLSNTFNKDKEK